MPEAEKSAGPARHPPSMKFFELWRDQRETSPDAAAWLINTLAYGALYLSMRQGKQYVTIERERCSLVP